MMKPGYKTTEFWLTLVALIVGAVIASGLLESTQTTLDDRVFALLASGLAALGYSVSRGFAKGSEAKAAALVEASKASPPTPQG